MPLANEFGTGQVFLSMLWFFLFFIWIWLLIVVFSDLFRSHDLSGWSKAFWVIGIIILPYLGVLLHLAAPGDQVHEHAEVRQHDDEDRPERLAPTRQVRAAEDVAEDDDQ